MSLALPPSFFAVTGIANPIQRITAAMRNLASGDTASEIPFAGRNDEIGAMAAAVNVFREAAIANSRLKARRMPPRERQEAERAAVQKRTEVDAEQLRFASDNLGAGLKRLAAGDLAFQLTEAFAPDFEPLRNDSNQSVSQLGTALAAIAESICHHGQRHPAKSPPAPRISPSAPSSRPPRSRRPLPPSIRSPPMSARRRS
ncbi:HAMP domain-containing protein [Rhizobium beringeri]